MNITVFGLSISSAWGNGHASLLRGLFRALHGRGHSVTFFEHDAEYYASHRDATQFPYANLCLYDEWEASIPSFLQSLKDADVAMVTSYCPHGAAACDLILQRRGSLRRVFYDMDTPVTLSRLHRGDTVEYLPNEGLAGFDLVFSYTGGHAVTELRNRLGAKHVATLYGWVDPDSYRAVPMHPEFASDLSYLGTFAADRQSKVEELLILAARESPARTFLIGGAMYPHPERWPANITHLAHVAPPDHNAFYSSSPLTLNVTRGTMAAMGYCPSGRLFEAAACGTAVLSDHWKGLDHFFEPGKEILIAQSTEDTLNALELDRATLVATGSRARQRTLDCHTAAIRAERFVRLIEDPADDAEGSVEVPVEVAFEMEG